MTLVISRGKQLICSLDSQIKRAVVNLIMELVEKNSKILIYGYEFQLNEPLEMHS